MEKIKYTIFLLPIIFKLSYGCAGQESNFTQTEEEIFSNCEINANEVNEGYNRCLNYLNVWLSLSDPGTGLIPRNINDAPSKDIWNAKDCAADNYPFMVLTAALLDQDKFTGRMSEMLRTETKLTSRIGALPDTWSFSKKGFAVNDTIMQDIIFGSAEYIKDGLLPLTEWLGPSPWSDRMISILDDIWKYAPVDTKYGRICSSDPEVNGDMLQTLSRIYWTTGDKKYLEWAERLGDYYLLGSNHPTRDFRVLRLRDHGCEIVSGLCELYATVSFADTAKKTLYRIPVYDMLDRILEKGRNEDGLFYDSFDPVKGIPVNQGIADNFGYTLNGFYTVFMTDKKEKYRGPVLQALTVLNEKYRNYAWEGTSSDGYADAIEGALNLYVREPVEPAREWIESEIRVMWNKQQPSGIIEGWHGDGNFARTTIMYCLWKSRGIYVKPWRKDIKTGVIQKGENLYITVSSTKNWNGKLIFDRKRHRDYMHLPFDWPRINQFPEYFTTEEGKYYGLTSNKNNTERIISYQDLSEGLNISIPGGKTLKMIIRPLPGK